MYLYTIFAIFLFEKAECLIGLRPPSADPTYRRHQHLQEPDSLHSPPLPKPHQQNLNETQKKIAKFILQRYVFALVVISLSINIFICIGLGNKLLQLILIPFHFAGASAAM